MTESREASVHALVGAYAIDALDDAERTQFERHLAECGDCRAEVTSLREAASVLGGAESMQPPASVRRAVLADIVAERPPDRAEPAETPGEPRAEAPGQPRAEDPAADAGEVFVLSRRRFRVVAASVAAAVLVAVGAGVVVRDQLSDDTSQIQAQPTLAERVQSADDVETVALDLEGAKATVYRSTSLNRAVVVTEDMPPPPEGMVYELWLDDRQNGYTPAGLMSTTSDQTLVLQGDAARATRVGITVEPAQGSSVPTSEPIAVFPFAPEQA